MSTFPEPILNLPEADIPLRGVKAHLSQGPDHQIIFMTFAEDVDLPEHSHAGQWGIVLEGRIDLVMDGISRTFQKGDRYFIPRGTRHHGRIYAGYADITYFGERERYRVKQYLMGGRDEDQERKAVLTATLLRERNPYISIPPAMQVRRIPHHLHHTTACPSHLPPFPNNGAPSHDRQEEGGT